MILFDWSKVYDKANGNILQCNIIMEMIIRKYIPKNRHDPLYKYSKINFLGRNFLIHPDVLLYNIYKYEQREIAIYYALAALRNLADYRATQKITLDPPANPKADEPTAQEPKADAPEPAGQPDEPTAPDAKRTAPILVACPMQIVCTSGFRY